MKPAAKVRLRRSKGLLAALPHPRASLRTGHTLQTHDPPSTGGSFFVDETLPPHTFYWIGGNPQSPVWKSSFDAALALVPRKSTLLCWSGTFADEFFGGDVRNWSSPGKPALERWLDATLDQLAAHGAGHTLGIVPHHTHLLSDISGQMRLWHSRRERGLATILHPAAIIAPSMMRDVNDHLTRAISSLGERCDLCILEDIALAANPPTEDVTFDRVSWHEGMLAHDFVHRLLAQYLSPTTPILLSSPPFFR